MSHKVGDSPNPHHFQVHSERKTTDEESSRLTKFEKKASHASSRSFNDRSSKVEKSDKPPLPERKSKNLNIQESNQSRKPLSLEQLHLDKINQLMSKPKEDVLFRVKLEHHIVEYEKALKEKGGWPWVRHVALSFFDKISSPALEAIKYNSNIDKSSPNFKALLDSFQNPKNEYRVKDAVFSIGDDVFAYTGTVLNGLPHRYDALPVTTYKDGREFYGSFEKGMPVNGAMVWPDEQHYNGDFQNGKPHGKGFIEYSNKVTYSGKFKDGIPDGEGVMTWPNNVTYSGEFKDGIIEGEGKLIRPGRSVYEGSFVDGKKHGAGKVSYKKNGSSYEGDFQNDRFEGKGKLTLKSGRVYEGNFKEGKFDGEGKLTLKSGRVYEGNFKEGKFHGEGKLTFNNDSAYTVEFKNGEVHRELQLSDGVYVGAVKNGKPEGNGVLKYFDGNTYTGEFVAGERHGLGQLLFANGDEYIGQFQNDNYNISNGTFLKNDVV
jgi:hypothetical protein